jgi:hypothetical protein
MKGSGKNSGHEMSMNGDVKLSESQLLLVQRQRL